MQFIWKHITKSTLGFLVVFGAIVLVGGILLSAVPGLEGVSLGLMVFGGLMFGAGFVAWLLYIFGILPR